MKKTIITLLALAGMVQANTTPQVIWDADFTTTSGVSLYTATGVATNLETNVGNDLISNGAITLTNDKFSFEQTSGNLSYADEFSMLVKLKINEDATSQWPVLFSLGETSAWNWKPSYYQDTNTFVLDKDGFGGVVDESNRMSGAITYTPGTDGVVTLALTNNGSGLLSLYVDGQLAGETQITSANEYGESKLIKCFSIGGKIGGGNTACITVSDAQFVKGITTSFVAVPEPTTATLSLLALAGLAARRRRK
ncbi:MAG: PEP-CTERM sorting domain-containing protein [Akkermansiaceae bacterium]|nr:PEP-CTERM sorting domain-containing protein [Akkermansiaceae bacterium]